MADIANFDANAFNDALSGNSTDIAALQEAVDGNSVLFASHTEMALWTVDLIVVCSGKSPADDQALYPGRPSINKPFEDIDFDAVLPPAILR